MNPKFSLLIGTLNRSEILQICLSKLQEQTYQNFEIIIIDQSDNDKTEKMICNYYKKIDIIYRHINVKGLSKARNKAIQLMSGDYFCLIDDDAVYSKDYLKFAAEYINKNPNQILSGYIQDTITGKGIVKYEQMTDKNHLKLRDIVRLCPSAGLVFPRSILDRIGNFDEEFGVGCKYGANEETDFLLRCRKAGIGVTYNPLMYIEHPILIDQNEQLEDFSVSKHRNYSRGRGALYKKHLYYGKEIELLPSFLENISKKIIKFFLDKKHSERAKAQLYGLVEGFMEYKNHDYCG